MELDLVLRVEKLQKKETGQYEWAAAQMAEGREHIQRVFTNRPLEFGIRYMKRWGN